MRGLSGVVVGVVVVLCLTGCSDGAPTGADPTVPTAASTTSPTAGPDLSVVPATIDEPYLNAVLAALDEIDGQATRLIYETKSFTPEAADLLNAIYSDDAFQLEADVWLVSLGESPQLPGIRPNPGNRRTTVERIIAASPACIWVAVRRDRSASYFDPGPPRTEYLALHPLDRSNDPHRRNPTPWMITTDGYRQDGTEPVNPCPSN